MSWRDLTWIHAVPNGYQVFTSGPDDYDNEEEQPEVMSHQDFVWLFRRQFQANIWYVTSITCLFHCTHEQTSDDQREPNTDPCCILMQTHGAVCASQVVAFFFFFHLGSSVCHWKASCCLLLYVLNIGADVLPEWTRRRYPTGERGNSFICRLPPCLVQIFHQVVRLWHESKSHFLPRVVLPFEIVHHLSRPAALTAGADRSIVISPCLMLFRKPLGFSRPWWGSRPGSYILPTKIASYWYISNTSSHEKFHVYRHSIIPAKAIEGIQI